MIPAVADAGIQWIATDEEILCHSTENWNWRDCRRISPQPGTALSAVARRRRGPAPASHLPRPRDERPDRLPLPAQHRRGRPSTTSWASSKPSATPSLPSPATGPRWSASSSTARTAGSIIPTAAWSSSAGCTGGVVEHPKITPVRVGDYLEQHPATDRVGQLFAGSWIQHNFGIWIGQPDCNRAWDLLHQTRQHLVRRVKEGGKSDDQLRRAWDEMYIAEGSDWFWWFERSHTLGPKRPVRPALPQAPAERLSVP